MATLLRVNITPNPASEFVSNYQVFKSKDGGSFTLAGNVAADAVPLRYEEANPLPGVYAFKIRAQNFVGNSEDSDQVIGPGVPSKPATPELVVVQV